MSAARVGNRVEWRRGNGAIMGIVVDLVESFGEEIWLFGWVDGGWIALNQRQVLLVLDGR